MVSVLLYHPYYLAYFNQLAGGPSGGYRVLVDSNLDWGQDLPGLVRYVIDRGNEAGLCRVLPAGAVTVGRRGEGLAEMGAMVEAGATRIGASAGVQLVAEAAEAAS